MPFWFRREGRTVGYGYVQRRSPNSLWYPEAITIGPIGAATPDDALAAVCAAAAWAAGRASVIRMPVPGPHPALAGLLDAGFQITYVETFVANSTAGLPDPACYVPSGEVF